MIGARTRHGRTARAPMPVVTVAIVGRGRKGHWGEPVERAFQTYPVRAKLCALQQDVLSLIGVRKRDIREVADALGIETPTAHHIVLQLERRGLAERHPGLPDVWGTV